LASTAVQGTSGLTGVVLVTVPYWTDCLVLLQQGQVAAISTDDTILYGLARRTPSPRSSGRR
jgi:polar amino acid transport system substrate-binding protein